MGNIRKQTIISSVLIYIGFFIGMINNYFYTADTPLGFLHNGNIFEPAQYALTQIFFNSSQILFTFGALGVIPVVYKFYPYYKDNLQEDEIDLISWALLFSFIGFIAVLLCGLFFKSFMLRQFSQDSEIFVNHYTWIFPLTAGTLFFSVTESFAWAVQRSVVSNFLKETVMRLIVLVLIVLYCCGVLSFSQFMMLFSFQFLTIFIVLLIYLYRIGHLHITFTISRVTRKFWKKMIKMQVLIFSGTCVATLGATMDILIIGHLRGFTSAGIFGFSQYASNLIRAPYTSIQSVSASVLSRAWKDKNYKEINRIYSRSSINLLLLSLFIFGNLWLNILPAMQVFNTKSAYSQGMMVLLLLGSVRIIDAGTGLNQMVINTSSFWRFDFLSSVFLLALRLPLAYYLINRYGMIGSAFAELISVALINFIRFEFLRRKFNMQPFSIKTLYAILLALAAYFACYLGLGDITGFIGLVVRAVAFSGLLMAGIFYWKLTPDAGQLYEVFLGRVDNWRKKKRG